MHRLGRAERRLSISNLSSSARAARHQNPSSPCGLFYARGSPASWVRIAKRTREEKEFDRGLRGCTRINSDEENQDLDFFWFIRGHLSDPRSGHWFDLQRQAS